MNALSLSDLKCLILSGNKLELECCKIIGEKLSLTRLESLEVADCGLSQAIRNHDCESCNIKFSTILSMISNPILKL